MLKSCFAKKLTCHMPPACKNCFHPPTPQGPHLLPLAAALERLGRVLFSSTPTEHPLYTCVCEPRPKSVVTAVLEGEVHSQHNNSSHTTWPHRWLLGVQNKHSQTDTGYLNLTLMTGTDDSIFSKIKKGL